MNQPRSEDELRAAFTAKATEAPRAEDVLRAVRREVYQPPVRRRWLAPAVAAVVIAAIGVPLGIGLSHGNNTSEKKAGNAALNASGARFPSPPEPVEMSLRRWDLRGTLPTNRRLCGPSGIHNSAAHDLDRSRLRAVHHTNL